MDPAALQQKVTALLKLVGNAEVSYDGHMRAVRIDNIDALKANVKNMVLMASNSAEQTQKFSSIFDLFLNDITPESAASLLKSSTQGRLPYDKPLVLNTVVPLDGATFSLYGASMTVGGTATLDSWEEGKAAHLTITTVLPEADMRAFMKSLSATLMDKVFTAMGQQVKPEEMNTAKAMVSRLVDNASIRVASTCKVDVDLNDTALTHSDCKGDVYVRVDMSKLMTDEQLKANPSSAAQMKVVTLTQTSHVVTDTVLAPVAPATVATASAATKS